MLQCTQIIVVRVFSIYKDISLNRKMYYNVTANPKLLQIFNHIAHWCIGYSSLIGSTIYFKARVNIDKECNMYVT